MANLKVNAKITAPQSIDIALVRADVMHVSATFRVSFEIGLSLTSTLAGYVLSLQSVLPIHWVFLAVSALATVAFLILSVRKQREAIAEG
jgi:predicted MFS family arabinose efflux permease